MLRVKMTADEEKRFRGLADERSLSFSAYVRMILQEKYAERKERRAQASKR